MPPFGAVGSSSRLLDFKPGAASRRQRPVTARRRPPCRANASCGLLRRVRISTARENHCGPWGPEYSCGASPGREPVSALYRPDEPKPPQRQMPVGVIEMPRREGNRARRALPASRRDAGLPVHLIGGHRSRPVRSARAGSRWRPGTPGIRPRRAPADSCSPRCARRPCPGAAAGDAAGRAGETNAQSLAATQSIPPAMITHSVASIRGPQHADISVYHARTRDARISMTFSGIHMVVYSCHAAQGLLEASAPPAATSPGSRAKCRPPEPISTAPASPCRSNGPADPSMPWSRNRRPTDSTTRACTG